MHEIEATGSKSYFFVDDNIICEPDYAEELFIALSSKNIRWFSQASIQLLKRPSLVELASRAGCKGLFLGIESFSEANLRSVKKGFNQPEKYLELCRRLEKAGIRPWISIIFGMDHDNPENLRTTINFLLKNNIWNVVLWIYTPLPGTDLYEEMTREGRITSKDWSNYDLNHVVFKPMHFSGEELERNFWFSYQNLYSAKNIIRRLINVALRFKKSPTALFKDLAIQYYTFKQLKSYAHPYSMGIGKTNN